MIEFKATLEPDTMYIHQDTKEEYTEKFKSQLKKNGTINTKWATFQS